MTDEEEMEMPRPYNPGHPEDCPCKTPDMEAHAAHYRARQRTVRVRIAVAVDEEGLWVCEGGSLFHGDEAANGLKNLLPGDYPRRQAARLTWVEADVPLPEPPATVEGEAQDGNL